MAKDTFYFSHDFSSRNDPKLQELQMVHGMAGIGVFWCLVEMLHEQDGYLMLSQCKSYAFALRVDCDLIKSIVSDFALFQNDGERFWSESALERIQERKAKSKKARESANSRWGNANALRTQSEGNAIKERKGNESKGETNVSLTPTAKKSTNESLEKLRNESDEAYMIRMEQLKKFHEFQDWIKENAPRVGQMKKPMTFTQWQKATVQFGKFGYMLRKMDNYLPLLKKNASTYQTLVNWMEREQTQQSA